MSEKLVMIPDQSTVPTVKLVPDQHEAILEALVILAKEDIDNMYRLDPDYDYSHWKPRDPPLAP